MFGSILDSKAYKLENMILVWFKQLNLDAALEIFTWSWIYIKLWILCFVWLLGDTKEKKLVNFNPILIPENLVSIPLTLILGQVVIILISFSEICSVFLATKRKVVKSIIELMFWLSATNCEIKFANTLSLKEGIEAELQDSTGLQTGNIAWVVMRAGHSPMAFLQMVYCPMKLPLWLEHLTRRGCHLLKRELNSWLPAFSLTNPLRNAERLLRVMWRVSSWNASLVRYQYHYCCFY